MLTSPSLILPYFALFATLLRALLVQAKVAPPTCARCGLKFERHSLGESICSCSR